jgi:hypothetical protein
MNPLVSKTCRTTRGVSLNHLAKAARRPIRRSRTKPEHACTSGAVGAASGPKRPPHRLRQVPKALAASFSASLDGLPQTACHARRRLSQGNIEVKLREAVGRKEFHLASASPQ